jgi:hypothetical protein
MTTEARILATNRNGNLHVNLHGQFTAATAAELTSTIAQTYQGKGNIFIHTAHVTVIEPESKRVFADHVSQLGLPREKLYMTGIKGLDISPDQVRVIVYEKKKGGCCGRCRNCKCHD